VHPTYEKSRANQTLTGFLPRTNHITEHDLYEKYPDFDINIKKEQELLLAHDVIIFQHPIYWYSCPPLMKQWIDLVLEFGWAYGEGGTKLQGKSWVQILTTGANESAYTKEGFHKAELFEFLLPFKRTAELCHMNYRSPFVMYGAFQKSEKEMAKVGIEFSKFIQQLLKEK